MNNPSQNTSGAVSEGDRLELTIDRMAHGGEGIATAPDGRVVFVAGAFPGDTVLAAVEKAKKKFLRAQAVEVREAGQYRVASACPAADRGAGCCDFAAVDPAREAELKKDVLLDQLRRVAHVDVLPEVDTVNLAPARGWRTRVRLGVDAEGRAGTRVRGSHELVTDVACTQLVPGLVDGLVGPDARRFTPGAEVIAVMDSEGERHVVESKKQGRGKRVENIRSVIEGSADVVEQVHGLTYTFPATAFWQAHVAAPEAYSTLVEKLLTEPTSTGSADMSRPTASQQVGWDLYGGVGLFVPAIAHALGTDNQPGKVVSVDYSRAATKRRQSDLRQFDVEVINKRVEEACEQLESPSAVVLDPPRVGAGQKVVASVAQAEPNRVVHIGCDPATFSRDVQYWAEHNFHIERLTLVNAFPGTHHFEVLALLTPRPH